MKSIATSAERQEIESEDVIVDDDGCEMWADGIALVIPEGRDEIVWSGNGSSAIKRDARAGNRLVEHEQ